MSVDIDSHEPVMAELLNRNAGGAAGAFHQPAPHHSGPSALVANAPECDAQQWFVARHRPYEGPSTVDRIRALGFEAHSLREEVRRPGRDDVLMPMFPGYLFVRLSLDDPRWPLVLHVKTVVGILSTPAGRPVALPAGCVEEFLAEVDAYGVRRARPAASQIGAQHKVISGPWSSWVGQCVTARKGRVGLLMQLFGAQRVIEFRLEQVERSE